METGNPFNPANGCGTIDGMPASCSEIRDRMEVGTLATEYLYHDGDRLRRLYSQIQSAGAGAFSVNVPYRRRVGTGAEGMPIYALGWKALACSFQRQNSGQPLSPCLQNYLRQFFPKMSVQGKDYWFCCENHLSVIIRTSRSSSKPLQVSS